MKSIKRNLGFFPTPIVELSRLSKHLNGPQIFMKRDDQSGVACGGNKVRKLEYLIGHALHLGADTLVSGGASQSNHCRQTAAAAAMNGLSCHLALGGSEPQFFEGNLLLDALCGATIHWCGDNRKGETIPQICRHLEQEGKQPYVVPYGGSNHIGALGFVDAISELKTQMEDNSLYFSHILFASSSGGTHAGMMVGARINDLPSQLIGVSIDKEGMEGHSLQEYILDLANDVSSQFTDGEQYGSETLTLINDYTGAGYGVVGQLELEALRLTASLEGIFLDPVYTGRAMGGLIDMIRNGYFKPSDSILFWHTGGTPALFAYGDTLLNRMK